MAKDEMDSFEKRPLKVSQGPWPLKRGGGGLPFKKTPLAAQAALG